MSSSFVALIYRKKLNRHEIPVYVYTPSDLEYDINFYSRICVLSERNSDPILNNRVESGPYTY